ncbi:MAG: hypothetical protein DMF61_09250 [Blastocatellia bacterium AA13]|nr:MAG: hypothetical protein DMF61_09250 [Blastocatellia bacterium AA13]
MTSLLRVRDINFSYAGPILQGVSFDAAEADIVAVLGPNGSGKSTLLKTIVGILSPKSGTVSVESRDLAKLSRREAAQLIGYVAQESASMFPLTAMEYVLLGRFAFGKLIGFESDEDVREATRAMELTETYSFKSRPISELSGGERQRVMFARAIASRPRLLVLDEPAANLDIAHQVKMLDLMKRLTQERGMTVVLVTHELNLAAEFATRVLMLKSGRVHAFGEPSQVMTQRKLRELFEANLMVDVNPMSGAPRVTVSASDALH